MSQAPRKSKKRRRPADEEAEPARRKKTSRKRTADADGGESRRKRRSRDAEEPAEPPRKAGGETSRRKRRATQEAAAEPEGRSAGKETSRRKRKKPAEDAAPESRRKSTGKRRSRDAEEPEESGRKRRSRSEDGDDSQRKKRKTTGKRRAPDDDEDETPRESKRSRDRGAKGESRRAKRGASSRRRGGDDDDLEDQGGGGGMGKVVLLVLLVALIGGGAAAAFVFLKPDLPTLVKRLDGVKPPKDPYNTKVHKKQPLAGLIEFGDQAVGPCEKVLLDSGRSLEARAGAAIVLGRLKAAKTAPSLAKQLGGEEKLADCAGAALVRIGAPGIAAIKAELGSAAPKTALTAIDVLMQFKARAAVTAPLEQLATGHADKKVRIAALTNLREITDPKAVIAAARALSDKDGEVREAAERALNRSEGELIAAAKGLMNSGAPADQVLAMQVVRNVGERARPILEQGLSSANLDVACAAAPGLALLIKRLPVKDTIRKQNGEIVKVELDAADAQARATFLTRVKELLEQAKTPEQLLALGEAAGTCGLLEIQDTFHDWLESGTKPHRLAACEALGGMGMPFVPAKLVPFLDDADKEVVDAVQRGLRRLYDRGLKAWRRLHMPADTSNMRQPPQSPSAWKAWWKDQKWVHEQNALHEDEVAKALELIRVRTFDSMKQAKTILETARERLIEINDKKGGQDSTIRGVNGFIEMTMKLRPTD